MRGGIVFNRKPFALVALFLIIALVVVPLTFGSFGASLNDSDCVMIKPSAYEGGAPICVRMPSEILRGWNAAAAYNLGYEKMLDGTYRKVAD